jgi:LysM repeat protein
MATKKSTSSKSRTRAATTTTATKATTVTKRAQVRKQQDYTAQSGDTLKSVADKFQVPLKFLARANNVAEGAKLSAGTVVRIPELKFDPFGNVSEGWVEIGPIWYQKGKTFGDDRIITPKVLGTRLKV